MSRPTTTGGREATKAVIPGAGILSIGDPGTRVAAGYGWTPLSKVARLESGHTPSRTRDDYWNGGIPWIGIKDATSHHGEIIRTTFQHVSQLGVDSSSTRLLPEGTVCLSRTASVGYVIQMAVPMCTSQDFVNWVCGDDLNPSYLRYGLLVESDSIRRWATGSTHQTLYYPEAKAMHMLMPLRSTQDAVVDVLGALDDKVAANRKIVSTSSDLLDAYYLGASPAESGQTFGDVATIGGGGTPSTKNDEYWGGCVSWATPTDITGLAGPWLFETARTVTELGLGACASPLYPRGSILMTSRATIGLIALASVPTAVNQGFIVVNALDPQMQRWLLAQMKARVSEFLSWANGATFLEISRGVFKSLPFYTCEAADLERFNRRVETLLARQESAQRENQILARTRDELLPLLMSGKITVKQAEAKAEAVL